MVEEPFCVFSVSSLKFLCVSWSSFFVLSVCVSLGMSFGYLLVGHWVLDVDCHGLIIVGWALGSG